MKHHSKDLLCVLISWCADKPQQAFWWTQARERPNGIIYAFLFSAWGEAAVVHSDTLPWVRLNEDICVQRGGVYVPFSSCARQSEGPGYCGRYVGSINSGLLDEVDEVLTSTWFCWQNQKPFICVHKIQVHTRVEWVWSKTYQMGLCFQFCLAFYWLKLCCCLQLRTTGNREIELLPKFGLFCL